MVKIRFLKIECLKFKGPLTRGPFEGEGVDSSLPVSIASDIGDANGDEADRNLFGVLTGVRILVDSRPSMPAGARFSHNPEQMSHNES